MGGGGHSIYLIYLPLFPCRENKQNSEIQVLATITLVHIKPMISTAQLQKMKTPDESG